MRIDILSNFIEDNIVLVIGGYTERKMFPCVGLPMQ